MTKAEAARIIEKLVSTQMGLHPKYRYITMVEELALRKAVKALRKSRQNEPKEVVDD